MALQLRLAEKSSARTTSARLFSGRRRRRLGTMAARRGPPLRSRFSVAAAGNVRHRARFPYVPGLLSFMKRRRAGGDGTAEGPAGSPALRRAGTPIRAGWASPAISACSSTFSIGVAKTRLVGRHDEVLRRARRLDAAQGQRMIGGAAHPARRQAALCPPGHRIGMESRLPG